ncbi:hypothetical protein GGF46_003575 [Coemansia sp. RSA 552]|nr:hypothetical protein GGF46_003575 [Coemansia sp. RSA 552]
MSALVRQAQRQSTCGERLAGDCHLRAYGVMMVDVHGGIVHADDEAIDVLRGPVDGWDDNKCAGAVHQHWTFMERVSVGGRAPGDRHHYLVVRRAEDSAVAWVQVCIHSVLHSGQILFIWHVRDVTASARCLEMSRAPAPGDYMLSLEDDGMPHTALLTRKPGVPEPATRDQLVELLEEAVASEHFAVLYLTGFGAVDSLFPRRLLGWSEPDLLDRSFVSLLCDEDRGFFCRALRRCHRDGIPQRLALKLEGSLGSYLSCDVTVLMPEPLQQPVLVIRSNGQQALAPQTQQHAVYRALLSSQKQQGEGDAPISSIRERVHAVSFPSPSLSPTHLDIVNRIPDTAVHQKPMPSYRGDELLPALSMSSPPPPACAGAMHDAASFVPGTCAPPPPPSATARRTLTPCTSRGGIGLALAATAGGHCDNKQLPGPEPIEGGVSSLVSPTLQVRTDSSVSLKPAVLSTEANSKIDIPMCEIFAVSGRSRAHACYSAATAYGQFSPASSSFVSIMEHIGSTTAGLDSPATSALLAAAAAEHNDI